MTDANDVVKKILGDKEVDPTEKLGLGEGRGLGKKHLHKGCGCSLKEE